MFNSLSDRLQDTFDKLRGKGRLTEDDINLAMREIRMRFSRQTSTSAWSSSSWDAARRSA